MKLAVFGGTGKTGRILVKQALAAGHEVQMLARTPSKAEIANARLRIVQGDALDPNRVQEVISGADAVVSLLGPAKGAPPRSVSRSTENIIQAARACGVRRLIVVAGAGIGDANDKPGLFDKVISFALRTAAKDAYEDMSATARAVRASQLDWTLVRISILTNNPAKGRPKLSYLGKGAGMRLTRAGLATFMLQEAVDQAYLRQAPVLSD